MKPAKPRKTRPKAPPVALPAGAMVHTGPTKGLKKWFARREVEASGGRRSTRGH